MDFETPSERRGQGQGGDRVGYGATSTGVGRQELGRAPAMAWARGQGKEGIGENRVMDEG